MRLPVEERDGVDLFVAHGDLPYPALEVSGSRIARTDTVQYQTHAEKRCICSISSGISSWLDGGRGVLIPDRGTRFSRNPLLHLTFRSIFFELR